MTRVVNDTDKLTYILTSYGLARVAEALADSTVNIMLSYIKIGDANFEYYTPTEDQTDLINPINNGSFPIIDKDLLEDGLTTSFHSVFPENISNCEIREVGIYETVDGKDYLFAISTQQPLLKPPTDLNYFTTVDYYAFLKSQNLADIYDQIVLNPDTQLVSQEDLDNLMSTIAFTESNLMEQINGNSRVIGLNRAQQLYDKVEENRVSCGYTTAYNNYSMLIDYVDPESIFSYWLFNYPRRIAPAASIVDIGLYNRNLSCNQTVNNYERTYSGLMPMLNFSSPNYYYLNQEEGQVTFNKNAFNIIGDLSVNANGIASSFSPVSYATAVAISTEEENTYALYFNFRPSNINEDQSVAFTTGAYSFMSYINADSSEFVVKVGNGTEWITTLYFSILEGVDYSIRVLFNKDIVSLASLEDNTYVERMATVLTAPLASSFGTLTLGAPKDSYKAFEGYMDLKQVGLNINSVKYFSGSIYTSYNDMSLLTADLTKDISFTMMFALEPNGTGRRTILARSNHATNANIFEVNETENRELEVILYSDSENYVTFKSGVNTIPEGAHSVVIIYNATDISLQAFVGGKKVNIFKRVTGVYSHMNASLSTLYSFVYTPTEVVWADSSSEPTTLYNSDGTLFTGDKWEIYEDKVYYEGSLTSYTSSGNTETDKLYAWNYNDGLDDHTIYTKVEQIQEDTPLYNKNYTLYTGYDFKIVQSGDNYIIQYSTNTTEYTESMNVEPKVLYNFTYFGILQTIWTNDPTVPTVLYDSNGNIYRGTDWALIDNTIYYQGNKAEYNPIYNVSMPSVPVTSYVIDANGSIVNRVNSKMGMISVIKEGISENYARAAALNLEATLGNNPCTRTY